MKAIIIFVCITAALIMLGWLGLQVKPKPFSSYPTSSADLKTSPLPDDLPVPVERFYHLMYGDTVPVIESAVISGRGSMRVKGITFPARFRFTHITGQDYRHYIEATIYGLPLMKVNEHFLDGKSRLELPFGVSEGSKVDQGANLALWAEAIWMPSVWITDPQARWEPIDEHTALVLELLGMEGSLLIDVFTAIIAIGIVAFTYIPKQQKLKMYGKSWFGTVMRDMRDGFIYLVNWKALMVLTGIGLVFKVALTPAISLIPLLVYEHLNGNAAQYSLVEVVAGVGIILGGLMLGVWGGFKKNIYTMFLGGLGVGLGIFLMGFSLQKNFTGPYRPCFLSGSWFRLWMDR